MLDDTQRQFTEFLSKLDYCKEENHNLKEKNADVKKRYLRTYNCVHANFNRYRYMSLHACSTYGIVHKKLCNMLMSVHE